MNVINRVALVLFIIFNLVGCANIFWNSVYSNNIKLTKELLTKGDKPDYTSVMGAIKNRNIEMLKLLIDNGAKINGEDYRFGHDTAEFQGIPPLVFAAFRGHTDIVKLLLEKGAEVDSGNINGVSSLMWAADNGYIDISQLLIQHGAEVNLKDNRGMTPLMMACHGDKIEITKMLLAAGAKVNDTSYDGGTTPLLQAASSSSPEIIQLLVDNGADINYKTPSGYTIFEIACLCGNSTVAVYLYEKKADITIPENQIEINGKANHIMGDYFFAIDDFENAHKSYQKAQSFYKRTIESVNADLGLIYLKQFGVFMLKAGLSVAQSYNAQLQSQQLSQIHALQWANQNHTGIAGYNTYSNTYKQHYVPTSSQANFLFLSIPSNASLDEKEFLTKKKVEQFKKLSSLMSDVLLCFDKNLNGHDLHICVEEKAGIKR